MMLISFRFSPLYNLEEGLRDYIKTYRRLEAVRYLSHSSGQTAGLISESVRRFHPYDISRYGGRSDERNQPTTIRG